MASRFWISGVQIGTIYALSELENEKEIKKILAQIEKEQYLGENEDVKLNPERRKNYKYFK